MRSGHCLTGYDRDALGHLAPKCLCGWQGEHAWNKRTAAAKYAAHVGASRPGPRGAALAAIRRKVRARMDADLGQQLEVD